MVKFHPLIEKVWWIQTVTPTPTPGIRTETNMSPLTFGGGVGGGGGERGHSFDLLKI